MNARDRQLKERFGLEGFRPWQREAVEALLHGNGSVLVVAPTGGGKSLCYQFPATELPGTTVVVSPLIALMEDQVHALRRRGIEATFLASTLSYQERLERERRLSRGSYRLVYVAPERLASERMLQLLADLQPPLVAIDEAHCISQWGHDFRPDYLRLGGIVRRLAAPRLLACTATATPLVRDEIVRRLGMDDERRVHLVLRGFARPNLHLEARTVEGATARRREAAASLAQALGSPRQPGGAAIVYAGTRRGSERMARQLADAGWRAEAYHAGLEPDVRADISRRFSTGALDVVAATTAFGMGIDRPDIRLVVHTQAPGSIEELYQEVGRAGRDGKPAGGLLMTSLSDFGQRKGMIQRSVDEGGTSEEHAQRQWRMFLDLMRYVEAGSCRHDFILRYFGDEQETLGGCGHCDVCARLEEQGGEVERAVSERDVLVVRKALSGVARVRGRAGLRAVAQMLHGSESTKQRKLELDRLSTFGLLRDHSVDWIMALLRRLLTAHLVDVSGGHLPVPYLTSRGVAVMKGEQPVRVLPPDESVVPRREAPRPTRQSKAARQVDPEIAASPLFEALRSERLRLAREKGVPPYVVCHDRTLAQVASDRPSTRRELQAIHGMGPARVEAWGEQLLSVVRAHA